MREMFVYGSSKHGQGLLKLHNMYDAGFIWRKRILSRITLDEIKVLFYCIIVRLHVVIIKRIQSLADKGTLKDKTRQCFGGLKSQIRQDLSAVNYNSSPHLLLEKTSGVPSSAKDWSAEISKALLWILLLCHVANFICAIFNIVVSEVNWVVKNCLCLGPSGLVHWTQALVLSAAECGFDTQPWHLLPLSKSLVTVDLVW